LGIVCSVGLVLLALMALYDSEYSKKSLLSFVDNDIKLERDITSLYANGSQMGQSIRNMWLDPTDPTAYKIYVETQAHFAEEQPILSDLLKKTGNKVDIAERLTTNAQKWYPLQARIIDLIKNGREAEARALLASTETPLWRQIRQDLRDLRQHAEDSVATRRNEMLNDLSTARNVSLALSALCFIFVVIVITYVARGVFIQIGGEPARVASALRRMAGGDLTGNEIAQTGSSANNKQSIVASIIDMQSNIKALIGETMQSANSVVSESGSIRQDANRLSTIAEEQSASTNAIAAAIKELTIAINSMSDHANKAHTLADNSAHEGEITVETVAIANSAIINIAETMQNASATMEQLSDKVGDISHIVQTIRDIADQTNLLALNAAIEAARAGEQGRGFAVVADEVRKLAERTMLSTQEIASIVGGIVDASDLAKQTMTEAQQKAQDGSEKTAIVQSTVTAMAQSAANVCAAIDAIAAGLVEQSAASDSIADRVEHIAQGIDETHKASQGTVRHADTLSSLSDTLSGSVGKFKV
jgi:methyl-accepting chemotaxis protein